jgi:ABC-type Fe3+-hydroxamate transport system substrate-binding protein
VQYRTHRPPLSRRVLLVGAAAMAGSALAGCATSTSDAGEDGADERLVTLDGATAGLALLLGATQIGTAAFMALDPLLAAITSIQPTPVTDVSGAGGEIDIERLAALRPDLLVGLGREGLPPTLADLATLSTVTRTGHLDTDCLALATAMGAEDGARAVLTAVHSREADVAARLRAQRLPTVSVLSPGLDGQSLHLLGTSTPAGSVVAALDLPRPDGQRAPIHPGTPFVPISMERVAEHDADLVLLLTGPTADPAFLHAHPLWQRLDAVRAGRVVEVDAMRWATTSCALGAWWVLDDLTALLIEGGTAVTGTASPAGLARIRNYRARFATDRLPH